MLKVQPRSNAIPQTQIDNIRLALAGHGKEDMPISDALRSHVLEILRGIETWLVARPPSPAHWVLYQNMLAVWNRQFTPATIAVLLGLLSLAYSVMAVTTAYPIASAVALASAALVLVCLVLKGGHVQLRRRIGPWLASED